MLENYLYSLDQEEASPTDASPGDSNDIWSDLVSFDSGDDKYYTIQGEADSSAAQTVFILYDIRNILLIFLLTWLVINLYYRLKNSISSFMR